MNFLSKALLFVLGIGADVVSVTSGSAGVAGNVSVDLITFLAAQLLEVAELNMVNISAMYKSCLNILETPMGQSEASWFVEQQPQRLNDKTLIKVKRQSDTLSNGRLTVWLDQFGSPVLVGYSC